VAVAPDPLTGLVAAHVHFAVAAELAESKAKHPGSFAVAFLDSLDATDEEVLHNRARITADEVEQVYARTVANFAILFHKRTRLID